MEKRAKAARTKSEAKSKKVDDIGTPLNGLSTLESKFFTWKKMTRPFKNFPFLDNQLFSEYLTMSPIYNKANGNAQDNGHTSTKMKEALKFLNIIKYIEQYSDSTEYDIALQNISFLYDLDKESFRKEVQSIKKTVEKRQKDISIDQYFKQLMEKEPEEVIFLSDSKTKQSSVPAKPRGKNQASNGARIDLKDISKADGLNLVHKEKKTRQPKNGGLARSEEVAQRHIDEAEPVKKKVKNNNSNGSEVTIEIDDQKKEANGKTRNGRKKAEKKEKVFKEDEDIIEIKSKANSNGKTANKKPRKSAKSNEKISTDEEEEEVKVQVPEQYMDLHINNDVDSDDGEGFSFFYVNDNVFNKTKTYFEKKMRPEMICSCVGGCNDPTICPCARYNFENCGKTACYVYDQKSGKKKLANQLIRKDIHIYECSSQCACTKSQCFNSCVNEGSSNRFNVDDFIVERYKKTYHGQNPNLKHCSATMWGLKAKVLIPGNSYVMEYCGEIITKKEGDKRGEKYDSVNCNYLFDLNKHAEIEKIDQSTNTIILNVDGVCETRNISKLKDIAENFPLVIDAFFYGNHSRFVNHSCEPNLVAIAVHSENRNILLPRIVFFALKDIPPGDELTIDYNCAPLKDLKNTEQMVCLCGAALCRGFVYEEAQDSDAEHA